MSDRYIKQFEFTNPDYVLNGPVVLEKGAVLLDTKTGEYILQLKLVNIGTTGLVSAHICIDALDKSGKSVYSTISANYGKFANGFIELNDSFGTKKLLTIPNNNAAGFCVYAVEVKTACGHTQTFSKEQYIMTPDLLAEHEKITMKNMRSREKREQSLFNEYMWGKGVEWYYSLILALPVIMLLFIAFVLVVLISGRWTTISLVTFIPFLLPFAFTWLILKRTRSSIGTPKILRYSAIMAIFMPIGFFLLSLYSEWLDAQHVMALHFRYDMFNAPNIFIIPPNVLLALFFLPSLLSIVPFLRVFFHARKYDKSLSLTRALKFWLPPQESKRSEQSDEH